MALFNAVALFLEKARNVTSSAMEVANRSTTIVKENMALVEEYRSNEVEARELMKNGTSEYMMANKTYDMAKAAYEKARKAKEAADNTAKDALEVLMLLTVRWNI